MAKRYYNNRKSSKKTNSNRELTKLAYNMGRVAKGLKGDTKVADSYNAGLNKTAKVKKPLY